MTHVDANTTRPGQDLSHSLHHITRQQIPGVLIVGSCAKKIKTSEGEKGDRRNLAALPSLPLFLFRAAPDYLGTTLFSERPQQANHPDSVAAVNSCFTPWLELLVGKHMTVLLCMEYAGKVDQRCCRSTHSLTTSAKATEIVVFSELILRSVCQWIKGLCVRLGNL